MNPVLFTLAPLLALILACGLVLVPGTPWAAGPAKEANAAKTRAASLRVAGATTVSSPDASSTSPDAGKDAGVLPDEPTPNLPPAAIVQQALRANPGIRAADKQIPVAQAKRAELEAGDYEWTLLIGGQQRQVNPDVGGDQRFAEWNTDLQRQVRLPGKASLDGELGGLGVEQAERRRADTEHELARDLLKTWFTWLKAEAAVAQWLAEVSLLRKQAKALSRRHELGDAARLETVQGDAAVAQAEAQLAQAQGRLDQAAEDLGRRYPEIPLEEQRSIATPPALEGDEAAWIAALVRHDHQLGLAQGESRLSRVGVKRAASDRWPDPTFGLHLASERDGEENIVGAYVILNLPGGARRAKADAALAEAEAANEREAAALQRVTAEAASLYQKALAARRSWQSTQQAASRLAQAADMTARAYQLGEGKLEDLLTARRQANEAALGARLSQLDALEAHYRLRLDAHRLWDFAPGT
jgi:outer membrane protein TolC